MTLSESRTSHPVGTTVKVEKYLQNLPVRRQAAETMAVKMLAKIKRLLQAYALARPYLRLSLKILKAKDRKGDWVYPKSGVLSASRLEASLHAATDVFGKKLMSQCEITFSSWSSTGDRIDEATSEEMGPTAGGDGLYTLEAIMAKRDCGAYIPTIIRNHKEHVLTKPLYRWLSLEQCRPLYISRFKTGVMHKGNFEADGLIIQIPLTLCCLQREQRKDIRAVLVFEYRLPARELRRKC